MLTLKQIFLILFISNIQAILFVGYKFLFPDSSERITATLKETPSPYKFEDPVTAFYILQEVDEFEPVDDKYYNNFEKVKNQYEKPFLGLKSDENYCMKHRAYFADHPEFIFNEVNFVTDHIPGSLVREKALKAIGNDLYPKIGGSMPKNLKEKFLYDIRPDVNFYCTNVGMHTYKHIGKDFACITQIASNIAGRATINRKDYAAESVIEYAKNYVDRPQCFNFDKFFPKTWVLRHKDQCEDFFEQFNSEEYLREKENKTIVYLEKLEPVPIKLPVFNQLMRLKRQLSVVHTRMVSSVVKLTRVLLSRLISTILFF